jgi:hypothetical protein
VGDRLSRGRQANGRTFDFRFLQGTQALEMHLLFFNPSSPLSFFPFLRPFGALVPTFSLWASGRTSLVSDFGSASITGCRNRMCVYEVVGSCWSLLRLSRSFAHLSFRGKRGMTGGGFVLSSRHRTRRRICRLLLLRKGNFAHEGYLERPLVRALRGHTAPYQPTKSPRESMGLALVIAFKCTKIHHFHCRISTIL